MLRTPPTAADPGLAPRLLGAAGRLCSRYLRLFPKRFSSLQLIGFVSPSETLGAPNELSSSRYLHGEKGSRSILHVVNDGGLFPRMLHLWPFILRQDHRIITHRCAVFLLIAVNMDRPESSILHAYHVFNLPHFITLFTCLLI